MIDELEEKFGFKVENLNSLEKQTFFEMLEVVQKSQMTPEKLKDYLSAMREAVENEIVNEPTFIRIFIFKVENPKLIKLQARLQNYILLESFLISPKKAQEQLESSLLGITKKVI
jgi:hypothetical protein